WPAWATQPSATRMELVRRFANEVRKDAEALATLIARETGKPLWEARTEVATMANKIDISVQAHGARTGEAHNKVADGEAVLRHRPHGVFGVFGPYNFPGHLPNGHIVPALIAGNTVIFKPSEKTPAVGELLVALFNRAGIPTSVVQVLQGGARIGQALVGHEGIDGVLFTGSAHVGTAIHRQLGPRPDKIVALEMGGNNPLVVWDTPKIADAAALIVQSAFLSAGQRCTAARRLIVEDGKEGPLLAAVQKLIDRLIVAEPFADPPPFMGPMIDVAAADHLQEQWLELMMKGGKPLKRLDRPIADRPFLTPALIDVTDIADRPDEELFGPVLQITRVKDFDAAIDEANATRFGLAASLVGGSPELYDRFWANVCAGVINWNRPTNGAPSNAPFGGIGLSGNHRPSAYYAADYCAYPVTSSESGLARAQIDQGLNDPNLLED
ncbi:MAG: succinylglutamate-semialdehyde dehydrogenase, partial [Sphingomicrobium sp.]